MSLHDLRHALLLDAAALKDQVEAASLAHDTSFNIVHDGTVDLPSLGAAIVALFLVGAIAAWVPARRATSIQPIEALRNE